MMKKTCMCVAMICLLTACDAGPVDEQINTTIDRDTGIGMSADTLKSYAETTTRELIARLGRQQTYAMLGWQVEPDYQPMQHCFDHWYESGGELVTPQQVKDCEEHVRDLSRLYASYEVEAKPVVFKSRYYWQQKTEFDQEWPGLVKTWKEQGGTKDDDSYLNHPGCVVPLQGEWTGSVYFYSGEENPICRTFKLEALESARE